MDKLGVIVSLWVGGPGQPRDWLVLTLFLSREPTELNLEIYKKI